ncbi:MAG: SpoIIAA family protein [Pirellulales bacterium]
MFKVSEESEGSVLVLEAQGKLTDRDYKDVLIPRLETIIRERGKANFLLDTDDSFQGWELKALWDDARFGLAHRNDFDKMAVVTDRRWLGWALKVGAWVVRGEVRAFPPSQRREAHRWIRA